MPRTTPGTLASGPPPAVRSGAPPRPAAASLSMPHGAAVLVLVASALATGLAGAESLPPSGAPYAEVNFGAAGFLGTAAPYAKPGPSAALRAGIDWRQWLALGARLSTQTHEGRVPAPPVGDYFQLYGAGIDARAALRLGKMALFVAGGAGVGLVSTNLLEKVRILEPGERFAVYVSAGAGIAYQLENRHFALGLGGEWTLHHSFALQTGGGYAFLRYTR